MGHHQTLPGEDQVRVCDLRVEPKQLVNAGVELDSNAFQSIPVLDIIIVRVRIVGQRCAGQDDDLSRLDQVGIGDPRVGAQDPVHGYAAVGGNFREGIAPLDGYGIATGRSPRRDGLNQQNEQGR